MSMGSWYVIFTKLFEQRSMLKSAKTSADTFWKASSVKSGVGAWKKALPSATSPSRHQGQRAPRRHDGRGHRQAHLDQHVGRPCRGQRATACDGMAVLATVGSTAPFVGLFGTVWGIYNALVKIGISGQASIDKVAGPVGESLIMTAIGLAVAVPAVMGYNWLLRRNKAVMDQTKAFAGDLHNVLLAGKR
jgi:biopolymer transport protein ExbB